MEKEPQADDHNIKKTKKNIKSLWTNQKKKKKKKKKKGRKEKKNGSSWKMYSEECHRKSARINEAF